MKRHNRYYSLIALFAILITANAYSQEKASIRLDLTYHQLNNEIPSLRAQVRTRVDRRYQPVENLEIDFFHTELSEEYALGTASTDSDGYATLQLGESFKNIFDTTSTFAFYASVTNDPNYEDNDDDIEIVKSSMSFELIDEDPRELKVSIKKYEEGEELPAGEVEVKLQVKRMFGVLPIGDGFETDEDGEFTAEFPTDIPGDAEGNLVVIAFVEDDSDLGYLKLEKEIPWGVSVTDNNEEFAERSLWAARDKAPYWLLIFPNLIIIGIWGTMIYLVWLILKINKIGKAS